MSLPPEGIVERHEHIAATLANIEEFNEVVLFGGRSSNAVVSTTNKSRIIRLRKCEINVKQCYYIY